MLIITSGVVLRVPSPSVNSVVKHLLVTSSLDIFFHVMAKELATTATDLSNICGIHSPAVCVCFVLNSLKIILFFV